MNGLSSSRRHSDNDSEDSNDVRHQVELELLKKHSEQRLDVWRGEEEISDAATENKTEEVLTLSRTFTYFIAYQQIGKVSCLLCIDLFSIKEPNICRMAPNIYLVCLKHFKMFVTFHFMLFDKKTLDS